MRNLSILTGVLLFSWPFASISHAAVSRAVLPVATIPAPAQSAIHPAVPTQVEKASQPAIAQLNIRNLEQRLSTNPKVCGRLKELIAQNSPLAEAITGTVRAISGTNRGGGTLTIEQADGTVVHVYRSIQEMGYLGQVLGKKVVLTDVYCSRIKMAPPPPPVIPAAIEVPKLPDRPATLPPLPRREIPAPPPAREIIPQTW